MDISETLEEEGGSLPLQTTKTLQQPLSLPDFELEHDKNISNMDQDDDFGNVDDAIDLEALGLDNLMDGGAFEPDTRVLDSADTHKINDDAHVLVGPELDPPLVDVDDTSNVPANDLPGDGISLIVEVFGPMNGICPVDNDGPVSDDNGLVKDDVSGDAAEQDARDDQEHSFAVGDLVWGKTKSGLWWPGMVCDPSASKSDKKGCVFVAYFGNTSSVWCHPNEVKPFVECFDQLSHQNKSKSFYGAIDKALSEIGKRVRRTMTCSCNQVAAQSFPSKDNKHGRSVFLDSEFEPANFLKFIRSRALDLSSPGSIEFTITEGCLSAFYCSVGHKQLPLYKLRSALHAREADLCNKDEDLDGLPSGDSVLKSRKRRYDSKMRGVDIPGLLESPSGAGSMVLYSDIANESSGGNSEKGELRERRKSKYLSYPYVNSWGRKICREEDEMEENEEISAARVKRSCSPSTVSAPIGNNSNKNSLRKSRKSVTVNANANIVAASSAEMLQELRLTAIDCFFPGQSTSSVPIQEFYLPLRIFRNQKVEVETDEYKEALGFLETSDYYMGADISNNCLASEGYDLQERENPAPIVLSKRRRRKKTEDMDATSPNSRSKTNLRSLSTDKTCMNGSAGADSVAMGPDAHKKRNVRRKKVTTGDLVHHEIEAVGGLPDLNGNNAALSVENMQVVGPAPAQGKLVPKRKKEQLVPVILTPDTSKSNTLPERVQVSSQCSLEGCSQPNNTVGVHRASSLQNSEDLAGQPNNNGSDDACSSLPKSSQIIGLLLPAKAGPKKRKRKEKASDIQNKSSALPDLNGLIAEPSLKSNDSVDLSAITSQGKPKRRRRRSTKSATGVLNPNGKHTGGGKAFGNSLLLNFGLSSSVPSKEYISGTFARFGSLVESKTQFLNESTFQVVFVKHSDAVEAFQSLQSRNPFGPALASSRLHQVSLLPVDVIKTPSTASGAVASNGEGPDLVIIKQNLEAMTAMLENAGDNLSPEMRAKLESEVKGFLKKVSSMVGSSSS